MVDRGVRSDVDVVGDGWAVHGVAPCSGLLAQHEALHRATHSSPRPEAAGSSSAERQQNDDVGVIRMAARRRILALVIRIRQARADDDSELARIDRATQTVDVSPVPAPLAGTAFFGGRTPVGDVLVAEDDGVVVGYTILGQTISVPSRGHVMDVLGLAVDPGRQRGGVGRGLVEAAVQTARRRDARKLSLRVLGSNVSARGLYERCGFVVEGVLAEEFCLDGRYVDDVLMARHLRTS